MATTLNRLKGFNVNMYGDAVELQVVDKDGQAMDLSAYTGISLIVRAPHDEKTLTFTGTFSSGGTDGKFTFTPTSSNTFDRAGDWKAQAKFTAASKQALTRPCILEVDEEV